MSIGKSIKVGYRAARAYGKKKAAEKAMQKFDDAMANPRKRRAKKGSYVSRPSQITKRAPSKRLKKRRRKNIKSPHAGFFPNPSRRPILFVITAQKGKGPKMHYDGTKFSQRERVKTFPTMEAAQRKALELLKQFSILRNYSIRIESDSLRNPR